MGNELWQLIMQSDSITKIVYGILLFLSVSCWTIFLGKTLLFFVKKRQMHRIMEHISAIESLDALMTRASFFDHTYAGYVVAKQTQASKMLVQMSHQENSLSVQNMIELLEYQLEKTTQEIVQDEESLLSVLSLSAAVSPLLGLFGTVWGLIHAFLRINETQMADIATIAPGIAEALMTTLAGLLVAIPALVMFNGLQLSLKGLEQSVESVTDVVRVVLQKHLILKGDLYASLGSSISQKQTHA